MDILRYSAIAIACIIAGFILVHLGWRAIGAYRINRAGPRRLRASSHAIWRDPGDVARLDITNGPGGSGGAPTPPFTFVEEHSSGSQPCVAVKDSRGQLWRVKWGEEVRSENVAVRIAWACGYFAETTYFIDSGMIEGAEGLQRAKECIGEDCGFKEARFELEDPSIRMLFEEHSWAWNDNPFLDTRELHGLKVLNMLLSNWDTKDRRDVARGSNTAIFEHRLSRRRREARYLITDWGGSLGKWGNNIVTRARWDLEGFEAQTPQFVTGVQDGLVQFGYSGQRTADVGQGIRVSDVEWLHRYIGAITDEQLRQALGASGADKDETERFAAALRERIRQLGGVREGIAGTAAGAA